MARLESMSGSCPAAVGLVLVSRPSQVHNGWRLSLCRPLGTPLAAGSTVVAHRSSMVSARVRAHALRSFPRKSLILPTWRCCLPWSLSRSVPLLRIEEGKGDWVRTYCTVGCDQPLLAYWAGLHLSAQQEHTVQPLCSIKHKVQKISA